MVLNGDPLTLGYPAVGENQVVAVDPAPSVDTRGKGVFYLVAERI